LQIAAFLQTVGSLSGNWTAPHNLPCVPQLASLFQAAARHEEASKLYGQVLEQPGTSEPQGSAGRAFVVERCCEAYAAVADWQGLQQWLQQWLQDLKVSVKECNFMLAALYTAKQ